MRKQFFSLMLVVTLIGIVGLQLPVAYAADSDFEITNGILTKYTGRGANVTVPDGVTSIGDDAFWGCENLNSIKIPNSVTSIGSWAFDGCKNLNSIDIPNSVTNIGELAFRDCQNLKRISLSDNISKIEYGVFSGCKNLKSILLPDTITRIGGNAFASIHIPNRVTRIENCTFKNCKNLKSITLSDQITSIGIHAFSHCRNLKSIEIPDSVTRIDIGACIDTGLEDITIPNRVAFIGEFAFGYLVQMNADYQTSYVPQKGFTIRGVTGSVAERYAMDNKIVFQSVGKPPETQEARQNAFSGPSDWSKDEVETAVAENIITQKFYDTVPYYTAPISRGGFAELAVNTSAVCYGFSDHYGDVCPYFYELFFNCHTDPKGNPYLPSKKQDGREAISLNSWRTLFEDYPFTDVGPESYPNTARKTKITAAKLMGVIHAYEDGSFHPDQMITRQQAATMIGQVYRILMGEKALEAENFVFSDDSEIADVFRDDVALVQTLGVMKQKPDGAFHPQDPYTIEESIVTFHRLAAQVKGEMPPLLNPSIQKDLVKRLNTRCCNILHIDDNFAIVEMWNIHTRGTEWGLEVLRGDGDLQCYQLTSIGVCVYEWERETNTLLCIVDDRTTYCDERTTYRFDPNTMTLIKESTEPIS